MKKASKLPLVFEIMMAVNSVSYGWTVSIKQTRYDLWALTHYVLLAIVIVMYTGILEKRFKYLLVKKKVFYLLNYIVAAGIFILGYYISTLTFGSLLMIGFTIIHFFLSLLLLLSTLRLVKQPDEKITFPKMAGEEIVNLAQKDVSVKRLLWASVMATVGILAMFMQAVIASVPKRHFGETALVLSIIAFAVFGAAEIMKFNIIKAEKKYSISRMAFEILLVEICFFGTLLIKQAFLKDSTTHYFILWIIHPCSCIPALLSSREIFKSFVSKIKKDEE